MDVLRGPTSSEINPSGYGNGGVHMKMETTTIMVIIISIGQYKLGSMYS